MKKKTKEDMLKRSQEIADQVKNGVYVDHKADMMESWFPERKPIKKDLDAIRKLKELGEENED